MNLSDKPFEANVEPVLPASDMQSHAYPPAEAAAQAPWPQREIPEWWRWEELARFPNFWEGWIVCGLLRNEGIRADVDFVWPGPDLQSLSVVWVPSESIQRARWVLAWPAPSEAELVFLATGEMGTSAEDGD